jgi:hypothetical protein
VACPKCWLLAGLIGWGSCARGTLLDGASSDPTASEIGVRPEGEVVGTCDASTQAAGRCSADAESSVEMRYLEYCDASGSWHVVDCWSVSGACVTAANGMSVCNSRDVVDDLPTFAVCGGPCDGPTANGQWSIDARGRCLLDGEVAETGDEAQWCQDGILVCEPCPVASTCRDVDGYRMCVLDGAGSGCEPFAPFCDGEGKLVRCVDGAIQEIDCLDCGVLPDDDEARCLLYCPDDGPAIDAEWVCDEDAIWDCPNGEDEEDCP